MLAERSEFATFGGELARAVREMFMCIGQTAIDENGFKVEREAEHRSYNARMSHARRWSSLFESKVASKRFAYDELPGWEDEVVDLALAGHRVSAMFSSPAKMCSGGLRDIVGPKRTPTWHNPAPTRECLVDSDLDLCRLLWRDNIFDQGSNARLGCLICGHSVAVRNKLRFGDKWFIPLADGAHPVKIGWPLGEVKIASAVYTMLARSASQTATPFLHVIDLDEWEGVGIEWATPLARMQRHGSKAQVGNGILCAMDGKPGSLLQVAARRGFFDLSKSALQVVAKEVGLDTKPSESCLERCHRLILHVLPGALWGWGWGGAIVAPFNKVRA